MRIYNLIVHIITGLILVLNGVVLFFPGLMTTILSAMFHGNGSGILMILGGAFLNAVGVFSIVMSVINFKAKQNDLAQYKVFELLMSGLGIVIAAAGTFVLFAFHQFRFEEIVKYGFEMFLFFFAAVIVGNLVSFVLTIISQ